MEQKYLEIMPLKDMANLDAAVRRTMSLAVETRPMPNQIGAKRELSLEERPTEMPKFKVPVVVEAALEELAPKAEAKKRSSWLGFTLWKDAGQKADKNQKVTNENDNKPKRSF